MEKLHTIWSSSLSSIRMSNTTCRNCLPGLPRGFYLTMGTRDVFGVTNVDKTIVGVIVIPNLCYKHKGFTQYFNFYNEGVREVFAEQRGYDGACPYCELIKKTMTLYAQLFMDDGYIKSHWYDENLNGLAHYLKKESFRNVFSRTHNTDGDMLQAQMVIDSLTQWYEQYKEETK